MAVASPKTDALTAPRSVTILGSTGSVGCNTLDLIARQPEAFAVEALTANNSVDRLAEQARRVDAKLAVVADETCYQDLKQALSGSGIEAAAGAQAVSEAAARPADWVMAAIVGAAGLAPTLAAVRRGAIIALANKETLVCAGSLMIAEVAHHGATLLPADSEHNAIFQVLDFEHLDTVDRIILTASGGPFRTMPHASMAEVTPEQAVAHPIWDMGAKISVDSATLMNKGLELIEAHHLFGLPEARIEILVHPQSVIHSMVAYSDGSVLAQMGEPDMRIPIAYTLAWPGRMATPVARLDLAEIGQLTFEAPDSERFPALRLARQALQAGGSAPTILNAANEVAVAAFLAGNLGFLGIAEVVDRTLEGCAAVPLGSLDDVWRIDREARRIAKSMFNLTL
jgi:1-deoxy-D-xylulose-5-phosphate reductoisomerase